MKISREYAILMINLYLSKCYGARRLFTEVPTGVLQSELVGDVAVPVSVRQAVLF